jgi:hypothetical protein
MALWTYEAIKQEIIDNMQLIKKSAHPEDQLHEFADSACPVYNSDIIAEWVELPWEDTDQWKELGFDTQRNEGGILRLMSIDLAIYYNQNFHRAWEEIKESDED